MVLRRAENIKIGVICLVRYTQVYGVQQINFDDLEGYRVRVGESIREELADGPIDVVVEVHI